MRITTLRKDEGSLPMAMLIVTVVLSISAFLVPVVVRQTQATKNMAERTTTLDAAQAGMDVMMARVRAAADQTTHEGYLENMPTCSLGGNAGVSTTGERLTYAVSIVYKDANGDVMTPCPITDVPTTATVTSIGTVGTVKRTLVATYVFSTSNTNIPGGQVRIASSTLGNQCLDYSGTAKPPTAGTAIIMATCDNSSRQQFGYTSDLYLKLIGSEQTGADDGMCLYAGATHASGNGLVFQPCPATTPATSTYQWSLDGSSLFHSANSSKAVESFCINVTKPGVAASPVALGGCSTDNTKTVWRSAPGVGAGMAGDSTNQLVNYAQFSRCLDVTSKSTSATYMIAWFCKQAPNGVVDFNQQWVHPTPGTNQVSASGPIIVNNYTSTSNSNSACPTSGSAGCANNYCLKSPGTATSTSWVTVETCKTAAAQATNYFQWTVYHDTGDYATSYRIKDYKGNCLQPTRQSDTSYTAPSSDLHGDGTSKVRVATCTSSELQKWNAPANISKPTPLTDLIEN